MKIGVDARMLLHSGIGVVLQNLLPRLISNSEHEWHIFTHQNHLEHTALEGAIRHPWNASIYSLQEQFPPPVLQQMDVVWFPHFNLPFRKLTPKTVVTIHDLLPMDRPDLMGLHKKLAAGFYLKNVCAKADRIICISAFTQNRLCSRFPKARKATRIIVNGISPAFHKTPLQPPPMEGRWFLYVGNIKPHKGLKTLIRAYLKIEDRIPEELLIVGQKDGLRSVDQQCASLAEKSQRIVFTGYLDWPEEKFISLYQHATAIISPSEYEGFGLPPLEGICARTAVIASDIPAHRENLEGLVPLFAPGNDHQLAQLMQNAAAQRTQPSVRANPDSRLLDYFSWDRLAGEYLTALTQP